LGTIRNPLIPSFGLLDWTDLRVVICERDQHANPLAFQRAYRCIQAAK
jgi:hypothetical protein